MTPITSNTMIDRRRYSPDDGRRAAQASALRVLSILGPSVGMEEIRAALTGRPGTPWLGPLPARRIVALHRHLVAALARGPLPEVDDELDGIISLIEATSPDAAARALRSLAIEAA